MKAVAFFFIFTAAISFVRAEDLEAVGVLPKDRDPATLAAQERNPFGRQQEKKAAHSSAEEESEENRIRDVIGRMQVVGRTRGADGWKVLLDNMILEKDRVLPPVIEGQTEVLKVAAIYDGAVEIQWVDKDQTGEPRRMFVPIDLAPHVRSEIGGTAEPQPNEARRSNGAASR